MTTTDFNINPYFDDYDETKGYYRILYRPGYAVQARELTQQQTILQKQIERFGNHIFEEGSVVTGAQHFLDLDVTYLKLEDSFAGNPITVTQYTDQLVIGQTSGAVARVIHADEKTDGGDPPTLYVKEISGTFVDGEQIVAQTNLASADLIATAATGKSSAASINEGVYFVNGFFAFVNKQILILEKYNNVPSYRIGLTLSENIITDAEDETLLDPANGSPNFTAPGAHRLQILLTWSKKALDFTDDLDNEASANFIEVLRVENGIRTKDVKYSLYSDLEDNLARRTFDESGNYTVEPFQIDVAEDTGDATKLLVGLEPGKAYVKGYEHRTIITEYVSVDKGRDEQEVNNFDINAQYGNYAIVTNLQGVFDPTQIVDVQLLNSDISGTTGGNFATNTIGTARIRFLDYHGESSLPYKYKMYLFDFEFTSGSFKDVESIWVGSFAGGVAADIDPTEGKDTGGNALLFGTAFNNLIFRTPNKAVQTMRPGGNTDTDFITQKTFPVTFTSGVAAINVTGVNTFFGAAGPLADDVVRENYILVMDNVTSAGGTGIGDGDVVDLDSPRSVTLSAGNQVATVDINDAGFAGTGTILATVNLNVKGERVKTLAFTTKLGLTLTSGVASLETSDVFRIVEIRDVGDSNADVTELFDLDNGQRDNFYDHGSIILKPGGAVVGPLDVDIEFFTHSGSGYFSVDSYTSAIPYEDIPTYRTGRGEVFNLRDVLDFRPRRTDSGVGYDTPVSGIDIAKPNTNINADYVFYLPRIDKVVLRSNREFDVIRGVSALNPVIPPDDEDAMSLYTVKIPAYTFDIEDVEVEYIDNRRYTMRDIGILEQRLNDVEYYTALTFLEKETKDLTIVDGAGIEQFKSGILVDSFTGHGIGDVVNPDYKCAIDFERGELRAPIEENNIEFTLDTGNSVSVTQTENLITLGYTSERLVRNLGINTTINVNPFNISNWSGTIKLTPETDSWLDTSVSPKVITNVTGDNDAWKIDGLAFGTQWNDWISNWAGRQTLEEVQQGEIGTPEIGREADDISQTNTRTQLRSRFSPQSIQRKVGTRTVNESIVPYIRTREIDFAARGLKPNTQVYPFFDGVEVSAYCAPDAGSLGDPIITDADGAVDGTFEIPASVTQRFKTGERLFRLTDSPTNDLNDTTTAAERRYLSRGLINTREDTIISTRAPIIRRKSNADSVLLRDPVSREQISSGNVLTERNWIDPLAQLFTVDSNVHKNGVFLRNLGLWFAAKDESVPLTVEIRPTVNGYPHSSLIVPFSQITLNSNQINVSEDGSIATTINFEAPVYLAPGQYCIVISTNSNQYELYAGEQTENVTNTSKRITKQPLVGPLFESQNITQYQGDDMKAIKFRLNRCEFDTAGEIHLQNIQPSADVLADVMYALTSQLKISDTSIQFYYKIKDSASGNMDVDWIPLITDQNFTFDAQKVVEAATADTLLLRAVVSTNDTAVTPVVDLERLTVITAENLINNDDTDETDPTGGNALAKYITRRVTLNDGFEADGLRVILSAYKSSQNDIQVYYKVINEGDSSLFDDRPWVEMPLTSVPGVISVNQTDFRELEYGVDGISYGGFTDFKTFAIKIVMQSIDTSDVPRIKDMRAIAIRS